MSLLTVITNGCWRHNPAENHWTVKLVKLTTGRWHYLVEQFGIGSLPDLLDDGAQLFIGLVDVTCQSPHVTPSFRTMWMCSSSKITREINLNIWHEVTSAVAAAAATARAAHLLFWCGATFDRERRAWRWTWRCRRCWAACSSTPDAATTPPTLQHCSYMYE